MTTSMFKTGMSSSLLTKEFFQTILDRAFYNHQDLQPKPVSWTEEPLDASASIISNLSAAKDEVDEFSDDFSYLGNDESDPQAQQTGISHEPKSCPMSDMKGHFLYKVEYTISIPPHHSATTTSFTSKRRPSISGASLTMSQANNFQQCSTAPSSSSSPSSTTITTTTTTAAAAAAATTTAQELRLVLKSKPIDTALIELTNIMAQLQGGDLAEEYDAVKDQTGFRNSHIREIEIAELCLRFGGALERISTRVYNVLRDDGQQLYALCLEYLDPSQGNISHLNSTEEALAIWTPEDVHVVLKDLAGFHAQFYGMEQDLLTYSFLENPTRELIQILRPAYECMNRVNGRNSKDMFSEFLTEQVADYWRHSDEYWATIEQYPRTLIHGDFNTRNICLRLDGDKAKQQKTLCAYDWELSCCHAPQRDVVEFLSFVLPPGSREWSHYIEYHRLALKSSLARSRAQSSSSSSSSSSPLPLVPSEKEYLHVAKIALMDFAALRTSMYGISNSFKQVSWLPRIMDAVEQQIRILGPLDRYRSRRQMVDSKL